MKVRIVKGWRSLLEEQTAEIRQRIHRAYSITVYTDLDILYNVPWYERPRWFRRVFFQDRADAISELHELWLRRRRMITAERTSEEIERDRDYRKRWRGSKPPEWAQEETRKKQLRVAAKPELYRAIELRTRAKNREKANARKRAAYAKKTALRRATSGSDSQ